MKLASFRLINSYNQERGGVPAAACAGWTMKRERKGETILGTGSSDSDSWNVAPREASASIKAAALKGKFYMETEVDRGPERPLETPGTADARAGTA